LTKALSNDALKEIWNVPIVKAIGNPENNVFMSTIKQNNIVPLKHPVVMPSAIGFNLDDIFASWPLANLKIK
tara:strand:- start:913 stop:1128 length:216 start_codon:yes stop_codon:yes gene_type:complete